MRTLDEQFPPTITASVHNVASFIPNRSPEFKVHKSPGLCHSALGGRGFNTSRAKYELLDGEWKRIWAYVPPDNCRRCNQSYDAVERAHQAQAAKSLGHHWYVKYHNDPNHTGPGWNEEPVCRDCAVDIVEQNKKAEEKEAARELHERYFTTNRK